MTDKQTDRQTDIHTYIDGHLLKALKGRSPHYNFNFSTFQSAVCFEMNVVSWKDLYFNCKVFRNVNLYSVNCFFHPCKDVPVLLHHKQIASLKVVDLKCTLHFKQQVYWIGKVVIVQFISAFILYWHRAHSKKYSCDCSSYKIRNTVLFAFYVRWRSHLE